MSALIELKDLEFAYGTHQVLNIAEFSVNRGERVFLGGPSGSGKTTLLGLIAGVLQPQKGSLQVLERDFGTLSSHERDRFRGSHMGYIFQMFNLVPYLTVLENVTLPCLLNRERRARVRASVEAEALQLLRSLGLEQKSQQGVTALSVGQQQRVAVARALIGSPELIIADEPTSSLDADHRQKFLEILFELADRQGTTVLFVSHDRALSSLFSREVNLSSINQVTP